ncbi:hypothetical protein ACA910_022184 [Epithemia clementina (nom. ined.)]
MALRRILLLIAFFIAQVTAFVPSSSAWNPNSPAARSPSKHQPSIVTLCERRWNFNEGQSPWGLKKNAEIWNGRVAQMAFLVVFLQELIQGKGVVQGIQEGDPVNLAAAAAVFVMTAGLTAFLAFKGDDDYVNPA